MFHDISSGNDQTGDSVLLLWWACNTAQGVVVLFANEYPAAPERRRFISFCHGIQQ